MIDARNVPERMKWFTHDRFGLFIHWGLYAQAARHEWVKFREGITDADYQKYFDHFDPDLYDPKQWARAAKLAGMKYFVITTKHHEGFCLWDSKHTDYKATNTPCGRDLLTPMVEAFRNEGLKVGFYYSLIDWHHPDFTVDYNHPMQANQEERAKNKDRDMSKYAAYMRAQVEELFTQFGKIDYVFYDYSYSPGTPDGKGHKDWESERLIELTRKLQPDIIVNDRLDLNDVDGGWDIKTPEQMMVRDWVKVDGTPAVWETCQTFSGSWGYYRDETTWKSEDQLLLLLIDSVGKGGNLLLNVGPTARGEFDDRAMDRLSSMGQWMKHNGRSIYGCTQAPECFKTPKGCRLTYNPETNRLYVHVLSWPLNKLQLDGAGSKVKYGQLLHDGSEVGWSGPSGEGETGNMITFHLPTVKPNVTVPVVELLLQ